MAKLAGGPLTSAGTVTRRQHWTRLEIEIANLCFNPGLVVMGDNSCLRGCGFKSRRHDGHDIFNLACCKNCIVCLRRSKINEKEDGVGQFKKSLFPLTREGGRPDLEVMVGDSGLIDCEFESQRRILDGPFFSIFCD